MAAGVSKGEAENRSSLLYQPIVFPGTRRRVPGVPAVVRKVKMTPEVKRVLRDQRKAFIKKFGHEPGPDDPVFFDPEASEPSPLNQKQLEDATLKAMLAAGTPPHFVYAYQKTGFIVDEAGYKSMSPEDRAEYDAAIDEYFAMEDALTKVPKQ